MARTQLQFTEEQMKALRDLAAAEERSIADLVREAVEVLLRSRTRRSRAEIKERALAAVGCGHSGLKDISVNHDKYLNEGPRW